MYHAFGEICLQADAYTCQVVFDGTLAEFDASKHGPNGGITVFRGAVR